MKINYDMTSQKLEEIQNYLKAMYNWQMTMYSYQFTMSNLNVQLENLIYERKCIKGKSFTFSVRIVKLSQFLVRDILTLNWFSEKEN
jgi:hypothetical protein